MRKMCVECPHKREHEVGDEICFVHVGGVDADYTKPHVCHMTADLPCVGSQLQIDKRQAMLNMMEK